MSRIEMLQESKDFWEGSVDYDRKQLRMSLAIGAMGLLTKGVGIGTLISGHPEGIPLIGVGGVITYAGKECVVKDLESYSQSTRRAAERQGEARGVSIASSSSRDV